MSPSLWQIILVLLIVVLLFGRGKISDVMGDVAKGVKSFKRGLADDDDDKKTAQTIDHQASETVHDTTKEDTKAG